MKNILSNLKTAVILLIVTIISLGFYAYMLARPISYGMDYHNETVYEGGTFEGTVKFYSDGTMVNCNTNFNEEIKSRYYYKKGYVFYTLAETDEEYKEETASINENFDEAIKAPFYADEINAFNLVASEGDGYSIIYTCMPAIIIAVVGGVAELLLIGLVCASLILLIKSENKTEVLSMKKDLIFAPVLLAIGVLLFLLKSTGMTAHIVISVVGILALIVYTALTRKEWKIPALEVVMRAFYGIALITGIVIKNVHGIAALSVIHKISAALFVVLIIVLLAHKVITNKKT